jgi:hypothetical protein
VISLARGQVIDPAHPALSFISQYVGQAVPAAALSWRILDLTTPANETNLVELVASTVVDLALDVLVFDPNNPTAGYYAPRWTVPSGAALGRYAIEWTYTLTTPASQAFTNFITEPALQGTVRKVFEVTSAPSGSRAPQYSLVADARDFLGCGPDVSDTQLQKLIVRASRYVERITGRVFEPRFAYRRMGGNSSRRLLFGDPIVAVSSVGIDTQPTQTGDLSVELDLLRIYNRHLSEGLLDPDDREDPMLEFVHSDDLYGIRFVPFRGLSLRSLAWPIGVQNIHVRGVFGYTEPDGSPWGETPELIQHVTRLIVARELPSLGTDEREDVQWRWRVKSEKARDVQIDMADLPQWGGMIGDPAIDSILSSFTRPPRIAST